MPKKEEGFSLEEVVTHIAFLTIRNGEMIEKIDDHLNENGASGPEAIDLLLRMAKVEAQLDIMLDNLNIKPLITIDKVLKRAAQQSKKQSRKRSKKKG